MNDFLKYLDFHLSKGVVNGKQLISAAQMAQLHKPVTVTGTGGYALGWNVYSHRGHMVWEHGGAITGFTSMMILLPEEKTGIVVLNNLDSRLPTVVAWEIADSLLGLEPRDYLGEVRRAPGPAGKEPGRVPGTKTSLELAAYAGEYFHPAYGAIHVDRKEDGLVAIFGATNIPMKHYHYDTFECNSRYYSGMAQFRLNAAGRVGELLLQLEPAVKPFTFVKR